MPIPLTALSEAVAAPDGLPIDPKTLPENRLDRIAARLHLGRDEIVVTALEQSGASSSAAQWEVLLPVLAEAEGLVTAGKPTSPTNPARLCAARHGERGEQCDREGGSG